MPISYPNTQVQTGGGSSFTPHAFELLTSGALPITITGSTGEQFLLKFFMPPDTLYKTQQNKYYLSVIGSCTGSSATVTASLQFNAGGSYSASLTPKDPFEFGFVSETYKRFRGAQYLEINLSQLTEDGEGITLPMYISGTSEFTASINKLLLSPV